MDIKTLSKTELNKHYNTINTIFKRDNKWDYDAKWNDELFDYIIVKKDNTNNYISGNFGLMLSIIDTLTKDFHSFKYNIDTIYGIIERYLVISGEIKVDNIYCIDINKYHTDIMTGKELDILYIKKKKINFNLMNREKLKQKFRYKTDIMEFMTKKLKLSNTFVDNDVLIYLTEDKKEIINVKKICNYMKHNIKDLCENKVNISRVVVVE